MSQVIGAITEAGKQSTKLSLSNPLVQHLLGAVGVLGGGRLYVYIIRKLAGKYPNFAIFTNPYASIAFKAFISIVLYGLSFVNPIAKIGSLFRYAGIGIFGIATAGMIIEKVSPQEAQAQSEAVGLMMEGFGY